MAVKALKNNKGSTSGISEVGLLRVSRKYMKDYGTYVIEQRALPDFRDGLKPVHRRILWAARNMGVSHNSAHKKSARLVGDVIGKFHPHGDVSVYDAMVNMENTHHPIGLLDGQGNWGTVTDNAAAMRYTEVRPTKYADQGIMPADYMKIIPYVPNYDGTEKEPVFLPALYPNLLLNGVFGIAVGVSSGIPPLHIESLMPLIAAAMDGKPVTSKLMKKHLRFNYRYGALCTSVDDDILNWLNNGNGGIIFSPEIEYDEDARQLTFRKIPPQFNWEVVVARLEKFQKIISKIDNATDKKVKEPTFIVKLKNTVSPDDVRSATSNLIKAFDVNMRMATNVTRRFVNEADQVADAEFQMLTPPNLISLWTDYRVQLEKDMQKHNITDLTTKIAYQELMLLAANNRKIIIESLDNREPETVLVKKLKITPEQANEILSLQVRRLSRMSGEEIKTKISNLKKDRATAKTHFANPSAKALSDMNAGMSIIMPAISKAKAHRVGV